MTWFVVGGVAVGATAGAIYGSQEGGDAVWKDALIGGAIGGTAGYGIGAAAAAPAATAAVPATTAVAPATTAVVPVAAGTAEVGSGLALGGAGLETGGAMAGGGSGIASVAPTTATAVAPTATTAAAPTATTTTTAAANTAAPAQSTGLKGAFDSALKMMSDHPFLTAGAGYLGLNAIGAFDNQNEGQPFGTNTQTAAGYPMSPNFRPSRVDPEKYRYAAQYAAEGGIMGYAPGGMVQQDPMNPMNNSVYPQAQQQQTAFATSPQMPNSMYSAMASDYDTRTNPSTGQELPMGMAEGGVAHFRKGGTNYSEMAAEFAQMTDRRLGAKSPDTPDWVRSKGIYSDTDPSTRYKSAMDASIARNAALAKKYDLGGPQLRVPTGGLGSINVGPMSQDKKGTDADADEAFASGGISSLGGYAHGGNPRLLRGPGDGMSDDIPATIGGRQPARLADGEFVIPADVVSALGNGSTEAGAKHLHAMMDKTRQQAHGKKTQMKKVNPKKVMPT